MERRLAGLSIAASAALLAVSMFLPTVTFERLGKEPETYSIPGGVRSLWDDGNWILAAIVFAFSMLWPATKLVLLARVWFGRGSLDERARLVRALRRLGKWSMLDVFIVATFVAAIRLGFLADASARYGIHLFGAAVLGSMGSAAWVERGLGREVVPRAAGVPESARGASFRLLSVAALLALVAAFWLPLVEVKKLVFRNEVGLPGATVRLAEGGEVLLACALAGFALLAPALRALAHAALRFRGGSPRAVRAALTLDEWAMLEVFALGLVVVFSKLDELADARLLGGAWAVLAASVLGRLDAWSLRRAVEAELERLSPARAARAAPPRAAAPRPRPRA